MIELQRKMRRMLFGLLSLFVISIGFLYNFSVYSQANREVSQSLRDITGLLDRKQGQRIPYVPGLPIGVVILDSGGQPAGLVTHESNETDSQDFLDEAEHILEQTPVTQEKTGNLYLEDYAWNWTNPHVLAIADLEPVQEQLKDQLFVTVVLGIAIETALWFLCRQLVSRMTRPIQETLEKQKQFIQDASHELKTPLSVITASADMMETAPDPKWIANIKQESTRMDHLIHTMLDLSRSEQEPEKTTVNLSQTVEKAALPYEALLYEEGCPLQLELQPDIVLNANREQLVQLAGILIDNASKHARPHTPVIVRTEKTRTEAILEVTNTGEPIPAGEEEKIFARFYRVDKARNRQSGRYGLGLAIAANICKVHDAGIKACSKDDTTTFTVRFPLKKHS